MWKKNSNNCLQKFTIIVSIFRIGMGFGEDHESLVIKSHTSNHKSCTLRMIAFHLNQSATWLFK